MNDDVQAQFAALGVKVEVDGVTEEDDMPIWREIWESVSAFLACETQWRITATMSQLIWTGLDYAGAKALLEFEGIASPEVFRDLRIMEAAALPVLNKGD